MSKIPSTGVDDNPIDPSEISGMSSSSCVCVVTPSVSSTGFQMSLYMDFCIPRILSCSSSNLAPGSVQPFMLVEISMRGTVMDMTGGIVSSCCCVGSIISSDIGALPCSELCSTTGVVRLSFQGEI
ncbi:MAG: hypothetical protein UT05_C0017G0009 [Parcubacteria group bacterium GW2011_GWF2_38_76]|nr:MAG: hypothetical protein UT05_C0017G0009 [Parcubacteria group bacterium GW2011_GWF2_38_76]